MSKTQIPKVPDELIVGAAMKLYAHANEVGEIDPSIADGLTVLPIGDLSNLSMDVIERMSLEEDMARDRASALARAAINGTTFDQIGSDGQTGLRAIFRKKDNPFGFLTEEDFIPGGRIDTVRSVGRISTRR